MFAEREKIVQELKNELIDAEKEKFEDFLEIIRDGNNYLPYYFKQVIDYSNINIMEYQKGFLDRLGLSLIDDFEIYTDDFHIKISQYQHYYIRLGWLVNNSNRSINILMFEPYKSLVNNLKQIIRDRLKQNEIEDFLDSVDFVYFNENERFFYDNYIEVDSVFNLKFRELDDRIIEGFNNYKIVNISNKTIEDYINDKNCNNLGAFAELVFYEKLKNILNNCVNKFDWFFIHNILDGFKIKESNNGKITKNCYFILIYKNYVLFIDSKVNYRIKSENKALKQTLATEKYLNKRYETFKSKIIKKEFQNNYQQIESAKVMFVYDKNSVGNRDVGVGCSKIRLMIESDVESVDNFEKWIDKNQINSIQSDKNIFLYKYFLYKIQNSVDEVF